jgi:hypothetical protein
MGVRILTDGKQAALYCSTTDWAFGPVFYDSDDHDAFERAAAFCDWLRKSTGKDPREFQDTHLEQKYSEWLKQEKAQWEAEEKSQWGE